MIGDERMNKVLLSKPAPGETAEIFVNDGCIYVLNFYLDTTTLEHDGNDVMIHFEDGADMMLRNFFTASVTGGFYLELPDGLLLLGKDMAETLDYALENFKPGGQFAAGESAQGPWSEDSAVPTTAHHEPGFLPSSPTSACTLAPYAPSSCAILPLPAKFLPIEDLLDTSPENPAAGKIISLEHLLPNVSHAPHESENDASTQGNASHQTSAPVSLADVGGESPDQNLLAYLHLISS